MALTRPARYDIEDSNIALLGSDLEKHVREEAASEENEPAWQGAGEREGTKIWRIEKFKVVDWPTKNYGSFYDGDAYILLHTYKKDPKSDALSHDLHFWLGENVTQDEAGTAAYKTVELDDHLHGSPVQYREIQNHESPRFISYFQRFTVLRGGVSTGFHHVTTPPPLDFHKLYKISLSKTSAAAIVVREVPAVAASLSQGDVFILDKGHTIMQFNEKGSAGKERFKAAEFSQYLISDRKGQCDVVVYDEGASGAGLFLSELGTDTVPAHKEPSRHSAAGGCKLFRVSDTNGSSFTAVPTVARSALSSDDAFILDASSIDVPTVYIWLGAHASLAERRLAGQYAQKYVYQSGAVAATSIVKMTEGNEKAEFWEALDG